MFKMITRCFYGFIIFGLVSTSTQAAVTDPTDAAHTRNSAVTSAPILMICDGSVETIHRSMDSLAFQPPASIDAQLAEYKAPNALMRKVIQGCAFVSPALTNSLSRSHLNRLYGQILDLHHNGGGLTMKDFNVCALILASLLENPVFGDDYSGFGGAGTWHDSMAWLECPFREQPYLCLFDSQGQYGANAPLVIFERTGHFGLNEITNSFLRKDIENRCHLIPLTLKACAHGGNITGPARMMVHDYGHAMRRRLDCPEVTPLTEFLLSPIFERISSWSGVKRRQIEYALFHILHEDNPPYPMPTGTTQKELGSLVIAGYKQHHRAETALRSFVSGWDIHPDLAYANIDVKSFNLDHPEAGVQITEEIHLEGLGSCTYELTYGPNLVAPYEAILIGTRKGNALTPAEEALYEASVVKLPAKKTVKSEVTLNTYTGTIKDEVTTLKWLYSGKWSLQNTGDTWQDVKFYLDEMPKIYDALMAVGLELWTDEPVPADILATVR